MSNEKQALWLIIIPDSADQPPQCMECADQKAFEAAYKQHVLGASEDLYAFAFQGSRIRLGGIAPIGSFEIGGKVVQVGVDSAPINESGRFSPLILRPKSD